MNTRSRLRAGVLLGSALALVAALPGTTALASTGTPAAISTGRLLLEPTADGYRGTLPVTITNRSRAADYYSIQVTEPVSGSFDGLAPSTACVQAGRVENRRVLACSVPGPDLEPGERRSFDVAFEVLTAPRPYAMSATGGRVEVVPGHTQQVAAGKDFTTLFRATTGSLRNPRPYVQDTVANAALGAGTGALTLTRQADGTYAGRLSVTVRYAGDAPHDYLWVEATLPAGVEIAGTDPQDSPSFGGFFEVPGGRMAPGEERTFAVLFRASSDVVVGDLGIVEMALNTQYGAGVVADGAPADNSVQVTLSASGDS
ncbi:hypothetical protein O7634_06080 [Micromonospora sp. WMMD1120]|uniref:hypothetical protein n=1 Tax=Micromonospora sp. WMMD1120 TaxID=3016106 RepID=UPI0024165240|nr:hypothetical protein [Micromonospora sp. WMMD1120]MDG4806320.1 hypothetical protein [Micromonospora sp. WMMD1120]